mmetsp:Transcript_658/g.1382  ORF Transcript_658/g.1382 Transcript_658/m.1382 type:complete len:233 (-) Transcript_658:1549-2247(-)
MGPLWPPHRPGRLHLHRRDGGRVRRHGGPPGHRIAGRQPPQRLPEPPAAGPAPPGTIRQDRPVDGRGRARQGGIGKVFQEAGDQPDLPGGLSGRQGRQRCLAQGHRGHGKVHRPGEADAPRSDRHLCRPAKRRPQGTFGTGALLGHPGNEPAQVHPAHQRLSQGRNDGPDRPNRMWEDDIFGPSVPGHGRTGRERPLGKFRDQKHAVAPQAPQTVLEGFAADQHRRQCKGIL